MNETLLGRILYESLHPADPVRWPRGRRPYRTLPGEDRERWQEAAESLCCELLDFLGAQIDSEIPLIGEPEELSPYVVGQWLRNVREQIETTGEMPA